MIASDEQISQPSLVWKQNSSHLHSLCVGILFNCTALGIHLCKTSQLYILKTRLGGEIYSSDVNMHKGYWANSVIDHPLLGHLHSGDTKFGPGKCAHNLCIFITSIKETSDLYSEEKDIFSRSGESGSFHKLNYLT